MKNKRFWQAVVLILIALFVLAPTSLLAEGPGPLTLAPAQSETITGEIVHMDNNIPGYWQLSTDSGDVTVYLSTETSLVGRLWSFHVGDTVEVEGYFDAEGIFQAETIRKVESGGEDVHFAGFISEITNEYWVVDGRTVQITDSTIILGDHPDVGDVADVMATQTSDALIGRRIIVRDTPSQVQFMGVIAEMNEGSWVVTTHLGDQTVGITDDTIIEGGDPDVGDIVKITAEVNGEQVTATHVIVQDTPISKHFRGVINEMADDYWVVGRTTVLIDENTVFEGDEPNVGDFAEVWGTVTPDGLLASRILVTNYPRVATLEGEVEAINGDVWTVDGRDVLTDDETVFLGDPGLGDTVSVIGVLEEDGTLRAKLIYKQGEEPGQQKMIRFSGFITEIVGPEAEGDPVLWVVRSSIEHNGEPVMLNVWISDTTAVDAKVEPAVGAFVKGFGQENDDGSIDARKVQVIEAPKVPFMGEIAQKPADGAIGEWVIDGDTVYVTEDTEVIGNVGDWGGYAKGYGVLQADGSIEALVIGPMPGVGAALSVVK